MTDDRLEIRAHHVAGELAYGVFHADRGLLMSYPTKEQAYRYGFGYLTELVRNMDEEYSDVCEQLERLKNK